MKGSRIRTATVLAVAGLLSTLVVGFALSHGLSALHAGKRTARRTDALTATVDARVALGRYAATHRRDELSQAATLNQAVPTTIDDRTILASLVSAADASGATLADEQRGQPVAAGTGLLRVTVTIDVNAPDWGSLVRFAEFLEHQSRLYTVSGLEFTTAGGASLRVSASVFVATLLVTAGPAAAPSPS